MVLPLQHHALYLVGQAIQRLLFMVYACLLTMSAVEAAYIFSIYSPILKSSLHYNQHTLNTLSFKGLAANAGILSGLIDEVSPPFAILIGSEMNLFRRLMVYLAIIDCIAHPPVWQM